MILTLFASAFAMDFYGAHDGFLAQDARLAEQVLCESTVEDAELVLLSGGACQDGLDCINGLQVEARVDVVSDGDESGWFRVQPLRAWYHGEADEQDIIYVEVQYGDDSMGYTVYDADGEAQEAGETASYSGAQGGLIAVGILMDALGEWMGGGGGGTDVSVDVDGKSIVGSETCNSTNSGNVISNSAGVSISNDNNGGNNGGGGGGGDQK